MCVLLRNRVGLVVLRWYSGDLMVVAPKIFLPRRVSEVARINHQDDVGFGIEELGPRSRYLALCSVLISRGTFASVTILYNANDKELNAVFADHHPITISPSAPHRDCETSPMHVRRCLACVFTGVMTRITSRKYATFVYFRTPTHLNISTV